MSESTRAKLNPRQPLIKEDILNSAAAPYLTGRPALRASLLVLATAAALLLGLLSFPALGRAAGPELTISVTHAPGKFQRGDRADVFSATVTNVGDASTTGPVQVAFTDLSPGLQVLDFEGLEHLYFDCPTGEAVRNGAAATCTLPGLAVDESRTAAIRVLTDLHAPSTVGLSATVSGGGAPDADAGDSAEVIDRPPFGVKSFSAHASEESGADDKLAGGHPFSASTEFTLPTFSTGIEGPENQPVEDVRNVFTELPPGFIGAATAAGRCTLSELEAGLFGVCPPDSLIGTLSVTFGIGTQTFPHPVYNMVSEEGLPAEFAFKFAGNSIVLYPGVRPRTEGYGVDVYSPGATRLEITAIAATLYGVPSLHDGVGGPPIPFLSNPVDCSNADPTTRLLIDSWQNPARRLSDGLPDLSDPLWKTAVVHNPQVEGCSSPALTNQWNPTIDTSPVQESSGPIQANQPAGLKVHLHFTQSNDPTDPANIAEPANFDPDIPQAPQLKTAAVALPAGMAISPSSANGLSACSDQGSAPEGDQVHYDDVNPATCPDSSKVGTVTATSPLLGERDPETDKVTGPEPVSGDVYILKPHPGDLPAGGEVDGKYRLLIQIEDEKLGLNVKLPGVAVANKDTGQITATFAENPQLPVKDLELEFFKGPRAALATPKTCGQFTTTTDLEAWSAPGTPNAHPQSTFSVGSGPNGTPCVSTLAQRPFGPVLSAGATSNKAGSASPFVMHIARGDAEQELSSLDVNLPAGLTAKLAGVPYCPEAAIAAAARHSGAAERANPSCPAASRVGTLTTGAGPGSDPYYASGSAYLAGPYKGAPLSFAFITPAVAGPFDLGNVVVRAAVFVDPKTARVTVKTDPLPRILDGIPLGIRAITAQIDRPGFTLNPTSCEAKSIGANLGGSNGAGASPSTHFQVGDCGALGFKPSLKLSLSGETKRSGNPALKAVLTAPPGQANIAATTVVLPTSEFIDNAHINNPCTRVQFAANACPAKSILGTATAYTPLLDQPLTGPVYFRSNGGERDLPDIVADLGGQIHVTLVGFLDSVPIEGTEKARVRTRFLNIPDAPVSRFVLSMQGGKKGLLENSRNLCKSVSKATVRFDAQNATRTELRPVLRNSCGKSKAK
jgi:hypothetical protein